MDIKNKEDFVKVLKNTKARIRTKATWCQYALAVDCTNHAVTETDSSAVRWCLMGALDVERIAFGLHRADVCAPLIKMASEVFPVYASNKRMVSLQDINDELGFEAIHTFLDSCILKLELELEEQDNEQLADNNKTNNEPECQETLDGSSQVEEIPKGS